MKKTKNENTKYYIIGAIFSIVAIFMISTGNEVLEGVFILVFFGGLGFVCFLIDKREKSGKGKQFDTYDCLVTMLGGLVFAAFGYLFLPIHGIFEDEPRYSPTLGWIVGLVALVFGVLGFVAALTLLIKNRLQSKKQPGIEMSNKGLTVINKSKSQFIKWEDVIEVSKNDSHFFVIHEHKNDVRETKIALSLINQYDIRQIENYINHKISKHKTK